MVYRPAELAGLCEAGGPDLPVTRVHSFTNCEREATRGAEMENSEELNQLAKEFSAVSRDGAADAAATARVDQWLKMLVEQGGSDLLLVESTPPCVRVQGVIRKLGPSPLDGSEIEAAVLPFRIWFFERRTA